MEFCEMTAEPRFTHQNAGSAKHLIVILSSLAWG